MKINDPNRISNARSTMDCFITTAARNLEEHPSCSFFVGKLENLIGSDTAVELWKLMLEGFREIYRAPALANSGPQTKFDIFAEQAAGAGLLDTGGEQLALWSGGFDMSMIAQNLGHCTLEKTTLGALLDATEITSLWNLEAKLWNAISRTFVNSYTGTVAHIYFRTVDEASVLLRQEVPALNAKFPGIHIFWHPIYYNRLTAKDVYIKYSEVGRNGEAVNIEFTNRGFDDKDFAVKALQEKLHALADPHDPALKSANSPSFNPNRAPFAFYF